MMDYTKIKWGAKTFWEFCGSYENFRQVKENYYKCFGMSFSAEEFGYRTPTNGFAYGEGDVVTCKHNGETLYAVVVKPYSIECGYGALVIKLYNGTALYVKNEDIPTKIAIAKVPAELIAPARAEAGKATPILEKCPLKKVGACMETER